MAVENDEGKFYLGSTMISGVLSFAGVGTCQGNFDGKARQGKSCLGKFLARQGKFLASFFGERYKKIFKWKFIFINSKRF